MAQDTIPHYEIQDTGMEVKGGSVVYPVVQTSYLKVFGSSFSPQLDYMVPEYSAPLKDRINNKWDFTSRRVVGKNPPTFNLTLYFSKTNFAAMNILFEMADNYGLKRLKGGVGIIENLPFAETDGSIYFIISRLSPSESASRSDVISVTLNGVIV